MPDLFSIFTEKVNNGECSWHEILSEIEAIKNENTSFDYLTLIRSNRDVDSLNSISVNQVKACIRKEMYENLSKDAKLLAKVLISVMNGDLEKIEKELYHKNKIGKRRIDTVMRKYFSWSVKRVKNAFNELSSYSNELGRME